MNTPTNPNEAIWGSLLTRESVEGWTEEEIIALCTDLNNAVMHIIQDHEQRRGQ